MNIFNTLAMDVFFEDREYGLGEVIDVSVTLVAKRRTDLRGIVAELVCEERWSNSSFVSDRPASERSSASSQFIGYMVDHVRDVKSLYDEGSGSKQEHGQWTKVESDVARQQTYVLGTTQFAQNVRLEAGTTTLRPQIQIPAEPPPHASKAEVYWTLRVSADVAWGPDTKTALDVRIV